MSLPDLDMDRSESVLVRARLGDKLAFNSLVSIWYKRIYNFSYKYFVDHDLASEAAQRTFIKVYDSLEQLVDNAKFKSWLYIIALNICREEGRKKSRVTKMFVVEEEGQEYTKGEHVEPADKGYEQKELSNMVIEALDMLGEEQKEVILMKEYEGLKFREIAEVLGVSENTVKSRLYYGLNNMKKLLEKNRAFKESYDYGK
ncbi:RNA polymerase sigma factor [Reichenbachiella ulvae]|uniref:RNA polymerase sigma factor n=1 Tax=Reichenbachiella ulvae TaxID=2980104 RepID=A0ABT3CR98_9BACT|nr:RNA polymerase sigma factor [Reichenbachiella ulvae]MCV9386226.1 RNA polymerase sigma factor [Reichenbachiella ulvae]